MHREALTTFFDKNNHNNPVDMRDKQESVGKKSKTDDDNDVTILSREEAKPFGYFCEEIALQEDGYTKH
eukprot:CAMPEP_0116839028 /NCGR_PEP_ID=MMETSP0418-20121206/9539_1 /TAXON_ID=1158023 /ORGANISM="Astrosyne radiata, Strain 13vi08-1A" /LENGTH=68 /DNA_ID=CAMNT_0004469093 /DNA_START=524 /DNA_END=730 /DNA_ORIENTATION=+